MLSRYAFESGITRLWRILRRRYKLIKSLPLRMEDICVIRLKDSRGTPYEARRDPGGGWTVYRICGATYGKSRRFVHEALGLNLPLGKALDMLQDCCPEGMRQNESAYDHPLQIAKIIRHQFPDPAG
jgi:hypothetical protein